MLRSRTYSLLLVAALALLAPLAGSSSAGAQGSEFQATTLTSAVAVPYIGTFDVWCTDRNPSPGICTSHHGSPAIDVGMEIGTPLYAAGDGIVMEVETECSASWCRGGAGLYVQVGHSDGTSSRYLHLSQVDVAIDDIVTVGQQIGLAGNSGSARSPHLHYDEHDGHYPLGSRTAMGPMLGCVDGEVVEYPTVWGYDSWNDVPFGTPMRNDGFGCLPGVETLPQRPHVFPGLEVVGIRPPDLPNGHVAELEVTRTIAAERTSEVVPAPTSYVLRLPTSGIDEFEFRLRSGPADQLEDWSIPVRFVPADQLPAPTCRGLFATAAQGTPRVDVLIGTSGDDWFVGNEGNDIICGFGGNDTIDGGEGDDWIEGGDGRDIIAGGDGRDRLWGGPKRDMIDGGDHRDRIVGGQGVDSIEGGTGSDVLIGGTGDDMIVGAGGRDRIRGGWGNDEAHGGGGDDTILGDAGTDHADGGRGTDLCSTETNSRCE